VVTARQRQRGDPTARPRFSVSGQAQDPRDTCQCAHRHGFAEYQDAEHASGTLFKVTEITTHYSSQRMKRLLASGLLPQRAGQPVKALVHMTFADLRDLDVDSKLQEAWIAGYRARWAGQRAAASVSTGNGGAWLDGDTARRVACDAILVPVVIGDLDLGAV
jgi:hypothetical protein